MSDIASFTAEELIGALNEVERRNAPALLHTRGDVGLLRNGLRVAIVGSRKSSEDGLKRAVRLARMLAERSVVVVSGLAEGIDTAAHRATIHAGGRTIAVIGTPLDRAYPRSNVELQAEIGRSHLLVSQFPIGQAVQRSNFVLRNRTMALLSDASVIVEAGEGSGSLSQGWEALRLGRPIFLLKSVTESRLSWPAKMLDHGALVLADPEDLWEALPSERSSIPEDAPF